MRSLALGVAAAVVLGSTAMADPAQNCVSNYYVTDANGKCIGDLIALAPPEVLRNIKNFGVVAFDVRAEEGVPRIATFLFSQLNCPGIAYMQPNDLLPPVAYADVNGVLWAPSKTGVTTINVFSYEFGGVCYAMRSPPTICSSCGTLVAPAQAINTTLIPSLTVPNAANPWRVVQHPSHTTGHTGHVPGGSKVLSR
jgi:hypothetical protein